MIKLILKLSLFFAVVLGVCWLGFNSLLNRASQEALPVFKIATSSYGIDFEQLTIGGARLSSLTSLRWRDIRGTFKLNNFSGVKGDSEFRIAAESLRVGISDFASKELYAEIEDMTLSTGEASGDKLTTSDTFVSSDLKSGALFIEYARYPLTLKEFGLNQLKNPKELVQPLMKEVEKAIALAKEGALPESLEITGRIKFTLADNFHSVGILTLPLSAGRQKIVLNSDELKEVARTFNTDLSSAEVSLIAEYPIRVPRLLQIKYRAEAEAENAFSGGESQHGPKDAFRYVLWSYLLSREFGTEFAQKVTNAHEEDVVEQGANEKRMDIQNATIGRKYFSAGVLEEQIKSKVMADPNVVKSY